MSLPEFELPDAAPPRSSLRWGWMLLWFLVLLLISSQLVSYFTREPTRQAPYSRENLTLRQVVYSSEATKRFTPGAKVAKEGETSPSEGVLKELDGMISDLAAKRAKDPGAALLYVAMRREQGAEIKPEDVAALDASAHADYRAAGEAYGMASLTIERAKELAGKFEKNEFVWKLARLHALEKAGDAKAREREIPTANVMILMIAALGVFAALLIGGATLLIYAMGRRSGRIVPKGFPMAHLSLESADRCALRTAQLLILLLATSMVVGSALGKDTSLAVHSIVAQGAVVLLALALTRLPVHQEAFSLERIGFKSRNALRHFLWGLAGALANIPLMVVAIGITSIFTQGLPAPEHPVTTELAKGVPPSSLAMLLFSAAVLAPIFEEMCMRGHLLPALASVLKSPFWAIVVSSLLFAMIHPTGVPAWPALAMVGATAAVLTQQTGSLVPAIVMHGLHNAGVFAVGIAFQ